MTDEEILSEWVHDGAGHKVSPVAEIRQRCLGLAQLFRPLCRMEEALDLAEKFFEFGMISVRADAYNEAKIETKH